MRLLYMSVAESIFCFVSGSDQRLHVLLPYIMLQGASLLSLMFGLPENAFFGCSIY